MDSSEPFELAARVLPDHQRRNRGVRREHRLEVLFDQARITHQVGFKHGCTLQIKERMKAWMKRAHAHPRIARESNFESVFVATRKHVDKTLTRGKRASGRSIHCVWRFQLRASLRALVDLDGDAALGRFLPKGFFVAFALLSLPVAFLVAPVVFDFAGVRLFEARLLRNSAMKSTTLVVAFSGSSGSSSMVLVTRLDFMRFAITLVSRSRNSSE